MTDFEKDYRKTINDINVPEFKVQDLLDRQHVKKLRQHRQLSAAISFGLIFVLVTILLGGTAYAVIRQRKIVFTDTGFVINSPDITEDKTEHTVEAVPLLPNESSSPTVETIHETATVEDIKAAEALISETIIAPDIPSMALSEIYVHTDGYDDHLNYIVNLCYRSDSANVEISYFFFDKDSWGYETNFGAGLTDSYEYVNPYDTAFSILEGEESFKGKQVFEAASTYEKILVTLETKGMNKEELLQILDTMDLKTNYE
ncbi:MAG: hypothetical protein K6E34_10390 [Lachnospiraceae bacterium]|nr:hypothetical protein [Lachnospiraceae bacterium]